MITLYATIHGHSKQVADRLPNPHNVNTNPKVEDFNIFVCPTYGDEELPLDMENFLFSITERDKHYTAIELGNYYDSSEFGVLKIIRHHLSSLGWKEVFPSLSLDSLPQVDWNVFEKWKIELNIAWKDSGLYFKNHYSKLLS